MRAENERLKSANEGLATQVEAVTGAMQRSESETSSRLGALESVVQATAEKEQERFVKLVEKVNHEVARRRRRFQIGAILFVALLCALAAWKEVAFPLGLIDRPPTDGLGWFGWLSVIASIALGGGFLLGDLFLRTIGAHIRIDNWLFERWALQRVATLSEDHEVLNEFDAVSLRYLSGQIERDTEE